MGRELRRKDAKKNGRNLKEIKDIEKVDWKRYILVFSIIIIFFVVLYFILAIFVTKEIDLSKNKDNDNTVTESASGVSGAILASNIFKQKEDIYYVYFYDFEEQDSSVSNSITSNLSSDVVYKVNTKDSMNSRYVSSESNKNATSLEDLKVVNPTLLKIENGNITMFLSGEEEIIDYYK